MKTSNRGLIVTTAVMALFLIGALHAQEHNAVHEQTAKSSVPEIFCDRMNTGQLCSGNAQMFNLKGNQKDRYEEALNKYNDAVAAAQKQFLADAKDKAGLSEEQVVLAKTWFDVGLNPEINKILATKSAAKK